MFPISLIFIILRTFVRREDENMKKIRYNLQIFIYFKDLLPCILIIINNFIVNTEPIYVGINVLLLITNVSAVADTNTINHYPGRFTPRHHYDVVPA